MSAALQVAMWALLIVVLDQLSKSFILARFAPGELEEVIPGLFNLTLTFNRGAAFGIFGSLAPGTREAALLVATLIALGVVGYFLSQDSYQRPWPRTALALILGGAIGNIIDRFVHGAVVDFLDFYVKEYHWPAFNVADSAICIGVALLIVYQPKGVATTSSPHNSL